MTAHVSTSPLSARRAPWVLPAILLFALLGFETLRHGAWGPALAGLLLPDLALAFGAAKGLAHGQIHPRGVTAYNVAHSYWLPAGLLVLVAVNVLGFGWFIAGLAWVTHITVDHACGYGMRDREGFQRVR